MSKLLWPLLASILHAIDHTSVPPLEVETSKAKLHANMLYT